MEGTHTEASQAEMALAQVRSAGRRSYDMADGTATVMRKPMFGEDGTMDPDSLPSHLERIVDYSANLGDQVDRLAIRLAHVLRDSDGVPTAGRIKQEGGRAELTEKVDMVADNLNDLVTRLSIIIDRIDV